jgi:hypothetical protein
MGKVLDSIDERIRSFIEAQHVFFVASAPTGPGGHVNVSPKGLDSLRVLGPNTVAYLDYVGSGAETIAHLRENGRIVLMFCAFNGSPNIVRLHGSGEVLEPGDTEFAELRPRFPEALGTRSLILVTVARVGTSCGYSVPFYKYEGDRTTLDDWAEKKGPEKLPQYQREKNATSIDGLPALRWVTEKRRV